MLYLCTTIKLFLFLPTAIEKHARERRKASVTAAEAIFLAITDGNVSDADLSDDELVSSEVVASVSFLQELLSDIT